MPRLSPTYLWERIGLAYSRRESAPPISSEVRGWGGGEGVGCPACLPRGSLLPTSRRLSRHKTVWGGCEGLLYGIGLDV